MEIPKYQVVISGLGRFYTDQQEMLDYIVELIKADRVKHEPRQNYYGNEKILDIHIDKLEITKTKVVTW